MKYEVTLNSDLPVSKRDNYIPLGWPIGFKEVKPGQKTSDGARILSNEQLETIKNNLWSEYEILQQDYKNFIINDRLRVLDLVHEDFKNYHPSKIDFTKHLKDGVHLEKREVSMLKNGRPIKAVYYYGSLAIAEIAFSFEADAQNFMTRRTETLGYYSNNGHLHCSWVISDDFFARSLPYQHQKRLSERVEARKWIIESMMADIDTLTFSAAASSPETAAYLSAAINQIMVDYSAQIDTFVKTGGTFFRASILNDTTHPILNTVVAPPNITMRMYIVDKLTY
jgi:hypothetical protein